MHFNITEAQEIATSGQLIGPPLGSSSTTSATADPSSSLPGTISTSTSTPIDSHANVGAIVGGVVGGMLGLLLIGVLIWWILRQRRPLYEGAIGLPSNRMSQMGVLQSPITNMGHLPQLSDLSSVPPTPYLLPPVYQGFGPSPGDSTSYLAVTKPRINSPGYPPPEAAIPSLRPMSLEMPNPPPYMASQVETREEQLRRAVSVATAGTLASSNNILPSPSTPEQPVYLLPTVPERADTPHGGPGHP